MRTDVWSFGGGTQSIAIAVLIAQGKLPKPKHAIFADTGREASETMEYFEANVKPIFDKCGLTLEIAPHSLATVDLYDKHGLTLIPAFTADGASRTFCSNEWKKSVLNRYLRSLGYGPKNPVRSWIGISKDEIGRAKESDTKWNENYYPLLFGVTMNRADCYNLIREYGLPDPPKSSCWMCPYRRNAQWRRLRDHYPGDFEKAVALDVEIRAKDKYNAVYLHDSRVPLSEANLEDEETDQNSFVFGEVKHCDSGLCWS
jgi:3'-phosphoadenosine 5'-phosphosulfate sulfotransferase (PAPS reductase)/FAD synthetase